MLRSSCLTALVLLAFGSITAPIIAQLTGVTPSSLSGANMLERSSTKVPTVLMGKVVRGDRQPLGEAVVHLVCNGVNRGSTVVKTNGEFSLLVQPGERGNHFSTLADCEVFAVAGTTQSDRRPVDAMRDGETNDVGSLLLPTGTNSPTSTVSVKSLLAPPEAKRLLEKGKKEASAQQWPDAEKHLTRATGIYPPYAEAWHELGLVLQREKKSDDARKAFEQALAADPGFLRPYFGLAGLAADAEDWKQMKEISDRAVALAADPRMLFYNAIASFNLKQFDDAERSLIRASSIDSQHQVPQIDLLLGDILIERHDYAGAAKHVRDFLAHAPDGPQAESAREELRRLEAVVAQR